MVWTTGQAATRQLHHATRNRRRFVGQAILYFIRQDYTDKELVIVDDGEDSVGDLAPADDRVRYVRLERRLSLGEKRNLAIEVSSASSSHTGTTTTGLARIG